MLCQLEGKRENERKREREGGLGENIGVLRSGVESVRKVRRLPQYNLE